MGCVSGAAVAVEGRFITVQELKRKQVDGYSDRILIIKDGSGKCARFFDNMRLILLGNMKNGNKIYTCMYTGCIKNSA
jgi:hypothetical protein